MPAAADASTAWLLLCVALGTLLPWVSAALIARFVPTEAERRGSRVTVAEAVEHLTLRTGGLIVVGAAHAWAATAHSSILGLDRFGPEALGAALLASVWLWRWTDREEGRRPPAPRDLLRDRRQYWPRERAGKALVFARKLVSGTLEEMTTRAALIGALSLLSGSKLFAVLVSVGANVLVHLYQRPPVWRFHVPFGLVTAVLYLKYGVIAPILLHLAYSMAVVRAERRNFVSVRRLLRSHQR